MEKPETGHSIATMTSKIRWFETYDLDNVRAMVLQQMWVIVHYDSGGVPQKQTEEWRNVEVVDGGLRV